MSDAVSQIIAALKLLAEKLGQGVAALYHAYYVQTMLVGAETILTAIVAIVLVYLGVRWAFGKLSPLHDKVNNLEFTEAKFGLGNEKLYYACYKTVLQCLLWGTKGLILLIAFNIAIAQWFALMSGINYIANPNYRTIQTIIQQFHGNSGSLDGPLQDR